MKINVFDNGHRSCNDKIINYASHCPITEKIKTSIISVPDYTGQDYDRIPEAQSLSR